MAANAKQRSSATSHDRRHWLRQSLSLTGALCVLTSKTWGQELAIDQEDAIVKAGTSSPDTAESDVGTSLVYESPKTERWKFGLILNTPVTCTNVVATFVVPKNWPEQKVTVVNQTVDAAVTGWQVNPLQDGAQQVVLQMAKVFAGATVEISFELDIERTRILPPDNTAGFSIPQRASRELRLFMGNSPNIDTSNSSIKKASRDLAAISAETDWERVEQIYDFVREKVEYVEGPIRNASDALKTGKGDCEDMTSLFVALCRNQRIPARMVWIPDHCYPEFYLEDAEGKGTWFPCQAAGTRQFGRMDEYRPILQKGDRFKVAESRTQVRYVSEFFKCDRKSKKNPRPTFIREMIDV